MNSVVSTDFVGQSVAQVTIGPRKLGYLVQAGSAPDLRKAIGYASTEWGGIAHPIVPVHRKRHVGEGYWQILGDLRPAVLIDYVGVTEQLKADVKTRIGALVVSEASLNLDEPGVHALVTVLPGSLRSRTLFIPRDGASLAMQAALGVLPADEAQRKVWAMAEAQESVVSSGRDLLDAQVGTPSPLWITRQGFGWYSSTVLGAPMVLYTHPSPGVNVVTAFWNIRALGTGAQNSHVLWLPIARLADSGVGERLRDICLGKQFTVPDLLILGKDRDELIAAAEAIGFTEDRSGKVSIRWSSNERDLTKEPLSFLTQVDPRVFVLGARSEGTRVSVPLTVTRPTTVLQVHSPVPFNPMITGKVHVGIDGVDAVIWPHRPSTARLVGDAADWTSTGLGFVMAPRDRIQLTLRVPDAVQVLEAALGEAGWTWEISDKGRYARALAGAIPGRASIPSLRNALCLRVVRALGSLTSRKAEQTLRAALPDSVTAEQIEEVLARVLPALTARWLTSSEIASELAASGLRTSKGKVVTALINLLDDQLVIRAFRFRCSTCGITTHVPLARSADRVRCEGCTVESPLRGMSGEPDLTYGLNSLLDRAADQDCHGHLSVQDWMFENLGLVWSVPGANVTSNDGTARREIDVLAVSRSEVLVSEVKNSAGGFSDPQVTSSAGLAADLGADHLVLATLDTWPPRRKEEVAALAQGHITRVTVLGIGDLAS